LPTVAVVAARDDLQTAFGEALRLAGLGDLIPRGGTVLLKPNQHGGYGFTSPDVLREAALWAFSQGAGEVWIGDGPVWSLHDEGVQEYFTRSGLLQACADSGATPIDFHAGEYRVIKPDSPVLPETIGFSEYVYEADVVINLPLMKTHFNTLVTMGIKNLKGCLRPIDKKTLHEMELHHAIAEVARLIQPEITATVLDATIAYEGMGPGSATPVDMGLFVASTDFVALDAVACDLMGIDPAQVRLIRFCAERGIGEMDLEKIQVVGEDPAAHRRKFQLPYEAIAETFPDLHICTENACSGCAMNLFRALDIANSLGQEITCEAVVIGPRVEMAEQALFVGHCTREAWDDGPHVPGCPPTVDAIRQALTGIETTEGMPRT